MMDESKEKIDRLRKQTEERIREYKGEKVLKEMEETLRGLDERRGKEGSLACGQMVHEVFNHDQEHFANVIEQLLVTEPDFRAYLGAVLEKNPGSWRGKDIAFGMVLQLAIQFGAGGIPEEEMVEMMARAATCAGQFFDEYREAGLDPGTGEKIK